jgi:hypothetical protein
MASIAEAAAIERTTHIEIHKLQTDAERAASIRLMTHRQGKSELDSVTEGKRSNDPKLRPEKWNTPPSLMAGHLNCLRAKRLQRNQIGQREGGKASRGRQKPSRQDGLNCDRLDRGVSPSGCSIAIAGFLRSPPK